MGTVTITTAGFAPLPTTAPAGWPADLIWPGNGTIAPNGTRQATITDAEMINILTWMVATRSAPFNRGTSSAPVAITVAHILVTWVEVWWSHTRTGIQQYFTTLPVVPPPINLN